MVRFDVLLPYPFEKERNERRPGPTDRRHSADVFLVKLALKESSILAQKGIAAATDLLALAYSRLSHVESSSPLERLCRSFATSHLGIDDQ